MTEKKQDNFVVHDQCQNGNDIGDQDDTKDDENFNKFSKTTEKLENFMEKQIQPDQCNFQDPPIYNKYFLGEINEKKMTYDEKIVLDDEQFEQNIIQINLKQDEDDIIEDENYQKYHNQFDIQNSFVSSIESQLMPIEEKIVQEKDQCEENKSIISTNQKIDFQDDLIDHQDFQYKQFNTPEQLENQVENKNQFNELQIQNSHINPNQILGVESESSMPIGEKIVQEKVQFEENQSIVSTIHQNQEQQLAPKSTKIKKGLAAETKNIPKNLGLAFQRYIRKYLDAKSKRIYAIKTFLRVPSSQLGKFQLKNYLKNKYLRQLAQQFFGSCGWAREFLFNNKTDISLYFRYLDEWNSNI